MDGLFGQSSWEFSTIKFLAEGMVIFPPPSLFALLRYCNSSFSPYFPFAVTPCSKISHPIPHTLALSTLCNLLLSIPISFNPMYNLTIYHTNYSHIYKHSKEHLRAFFYLTIPHGAKISELIPSYAYFRSTPILEYLCLCV